MWNEVVRREPYALLYVPDHFKTRKMCDKAVEIDPFILWYVLDHFKTKKICEKCVEKYPWALEYIPDWFVMDQQMKSWHDYRGPYQYNNDRFTGWYKGYKKRKAQKASIKKELMPIAWHPSRWLDWCIPEDKKKEMEKIF